MRELMLAYHVGVEVECKIAEAIIPRHYQRDSTHRDLRHLRLGRGLRETAVASHVKRPGALRHRRQPVGRTARELRHHDEAVPGGPRGGSGVVAAELAAWGGPRRLTILEAPRGFFRAAGGGFDPAAIQASWAIPGPSNPGVSIKPYPSGSLTHPGMTVMLC